MASEAAGVGGSLFGAFGAIQQGQAQANALDRAADIERNNAALDIETGKANAELSSINSNKRIGAISAGYGASGVAADSGSVLDVLAASTSNAELDRQNIMHGAKVRAVNYENQAAMDEVGAKSALQGSYMNAFSSLLMGGSKAFGQSSGVSPGNYQPTVGSEAGGYAGEDTAVDGYGTAGGASGGAGISASSEEAFAFA